MPTPMYDRQYQNGGFHHCPNGHSQGWNKDGCENARLRRERDSVKQQMARLEDEKREQIARAVRAEQENSKLKQRARGGACPCCQRSFTNVARHMKTKHPTFVAEVVPMKRNTA